MSPSKYSLQVKMTSSADKAQTKTFSGITNDDMTIAMGTAFAAAYLDLTDSTGKTVVLNGTESADISA